MQYEVRTPETKAQAVGLIRGAIVVMHAQIDYYRNKRKKAWDSDYVEHVWNEALGALKFLEATATSSDSHAPPSRGMQEAEENIEFWDRTR